MLLTHANEDLTTTAWLRAAPHQYLLGLLVLLLLCAEVSTVSAQTEGTSLDRFETRYEANLAFLTSHDRALGSEGLQTVAHHIQDELSRAGLEVTQHSYPMLAPRYTDHVLELEDGSTITLHPLPPNGPVLASPGTQGIAGPVKWAGDGSIDVMAGRDWDGAIAVLDFVPETDWLKPFELGAQAVILAPPHDGSPAVNALDFPQLVIPADLPRFTLSPGAHLELDSLIRHHASAGEATSPTGVIKGAGAWVDAHAPHITAVIPGRHNVLAEEVVIIHADMDRSELLGGYLEAASEATSAAFLLALAHQLAADRPMRTVILSFGSGRSRQFGTLRHWLAESEMVTPVHLLVAIDLGDGGTQPALSLPSPSPIRAAAYAVGIEAIDVSNGPGTDRQQNLGHSTLFASDVASWQALSSVAATLTTVGERRRLGFDDLTVRLDTPTMAARMETFLHFVRNAVNGPLNPAMPRTRGATACLAMRGNGTDDEETGPQWWIAAVPPTGVEVHGLVPLAQPSDEGCVEFVGLAGSTPVHAYAVGDGGQVVASHVRPTTLQVTEAAPVQRVPVVPARVTTLIGWPGPPLRGLWDPGEPMRTDATRQIEREALQTTRTTTLRIDAAREGAVGRVLEGAYMQQVGSLAVLHAPPGSELLVERPPLEGTPLSPGETRPVIEPRLLLALDVDDVASQRIHGRLAIAQYMEASNDALLHRLHAGGGRDAFIEGMQATASRELVAALADFQAGHFSSFEERLRHAHGDLAATRDALLVMQRDALVSLTTYLVLAIIAAAALGRFLVAGGSPGRRAVITVMAIAIFYALARGLHPGYEIVDVSPELITAAVVLGLAAVVGVIALARRSELRVAQGRRRLGERPDIDRYSLFLTAVGMGLSQLGKRRLRSSLTGVSLTLFVFALMAVGALTPTFQLEPQHLGTDPPYEGLLVRSQAHEPLADRVPEDIAHVVANLEDLVPIRWTTTERIHRDEEPPPTHLQPHHVLDGDEGQRLLFRTLIHVPASYLELVSLDEALVAGHWPRDTHDEILMPLAAAEQLASVAEDLVGGPISMQYQFPIPVIRAEGIEWTRGTSHMRSPIVAGIYDDEVWQLYEGLDGRPLTPPGLGFHPGNQLIVSANIAADFNAKVVAWAALTEGPPMEQHVRQLAMNLPYAVYAGGGGLRFVMGTALPTITRLALPVGILGLMGLLMVANTMLGAVYERREEFRLLHVVGLAPHHIRTLVVAEGTVLAVGAVVTGWTLVLAVGVIIHRSDLGAHLALNFNSLFLIILLLGMIVVTAAAAAIPAQLAAHTVSGGGREIMLPATDGRFEVELPFSVAATDIPALYAYLWTFFAPELSDAGTFRSHGVKWVLGEGERWLDTLEAEIQLQPAEIGINQTVRLMAAPTDEGAAEDARRIKVLMVQLSGPSDAWRRQNVRFLSALRKEFLAWDLVTEDERHTYHDKADHLRGTSSATSAG